MTPLRGVLFGLGLVVAGFVAWWGYGIYSSAQDAKRVRWENTVKAKDDSLKTARTEKASADSALAHQIPIYIAGRDRILRDPAKPASPEVRACYESADLVISACQKARAADSVVIAQQTGLITVLRNPPPPKAARRIQSYGEALYDVAHSVPVIRLGATARLLGPVSFSVAGEYAAPPAGQNTPQFRALAGARISF